MGCGFLELCSDNPSSVFRVHDLLAILGRELANSPAAQESQWHVWFQADVTVQSPARLVELKKCGRVSLGQEHMSGLRTLDIEARELVSASRCARPCNLPLFIKLPSILSLTLASGRRFDTAISLASLASVRYLRLNVLCQAVLEGWSLLTRLQWLELLLGNLHGARWECWQPAQQLHELPADLQSSLSSLTALRHLHLECASQHIAGIGSLCQLSKLVLSGCDCLHSLPRLARLSQLQSLELRGCRSLFRLPRSCSSLSALTLLDLGW